MNNDANDPDAPKGGMPANDALIPQVAQVQPQGATYDAANAGRPNIATDAPGITAVVAPPASPTPMPTQSLAANSGVVIPGAVVGVTKEGLFETRTNSASDISIIDRLTADEKAQLSFEERLSRIEDAIAKPIAVPSNGAPANNDDLWNAIRSITHRIWGANA